MTTETPLTLLGKLEEWFNLFQQGSIDENRYLSVKDGIVKEIIYNDYSSTLYCATVADRLYEKSALNEEEYLKIKQKALDDNDPDVQKIKRAKRRNMKILIWSIFIFVGIILSLIFWKFLLLFFVGIPLLSTILDWQIKEDIIARGVRKGKR